MSSLQFRCSFALAATFLALNWSSTADAQRFVEQLPPRQPVGLYQALVSGVWYDVKNQEHAVHQLEHLEAKRCRDAARGSMEAVDHDDYWIDRLRYRIAVDEWLIRKNSLQCIGYYPVRRDALPCCPISVPYPPPQVAAPSAPAPPPAPVPPPVPAAAPATAAPSIPITIVNASPTGASVAFAINGVAQEAAGGSRQNLTVVPDSTIAYDGGGSMGQRRYVITPGVYEFRPTAEGVALYKLSDQP